MELKTLFIGAWMDNMKPLQAKLHELIDPKYLVTGIPHCESGLETEPHCTIMHGGYNAELDDVYKAVSKQFGNAIKYRSSLTLSNITVFETEHSDVVKFDVVESFMTDINNYLVALGVDPTHTPYKPHATIAYVKKGYGKQYARRFLNSNTWIGFKRTYKPTMIKFTESVMDYKGEVKKNVIEAKF